MEHLLGCCCKVPAALRLLSNAFSGAALGGAAMFGGVGLPILGVQDRCRA